MNDNTVLFSSLLLDACIVPVSVPVCHLDSRQLQQQPPPSLMNNQQQLQHQQNNPPHLAYQQANHHSYTTVTTSNQHGPSHLPPGGGVMGAHQQGPVPPHLQQQVSPLLFRNFFVRFFSFVLTKASFTIHTICVLSKYIEISSGSTTVRHCDGSSIVCEIKPIFLSTELEKIVRFIVESELLRENEKKRGQKLSITLYILFC